MSTGLQLLTTIGLEIHVELATATKMFCGCPVAFGGEPNTRVCPVCLGHPGTLPVPNRKAVEFATKIALALGCEIAPYSIFHRKNYFYPDMPKNYQISQYDIPLGSGGRLDIDVDGDTHAVGITRVHLEEDTGKSIHVGGGGRIHEAGYSLEDFNRAGTPLVEIVTEPDLTSPEAARAFAAELKAILEYLEVSDVRMEEGSMRVDANVSVAPKGQRGVKVEIKNLNSLRSLHRALQYEVTRQSGELARGEVLRQSTRHWDEKDGKTHDLRSKEEAFDYRYFPEPDLVPIKPTPEDLKNLKDRLPELPARRRSRLTRELGLGAYDASVLVSSKAACALFEEAAAAAKAAAPKQVANWITNDLTALLAEKSLGWDNPPVGSSSLAELADVVASGLISKHQGKQVLADMIDTGKSASAIIEEKNIKQVSDAGELEAAVDKAIADNPDVAERVRAGQDKPFGFPVGQVMKATKGRGNPAVINGLLRDRLR